MGRSRNVEANNHSKFSTIGAGKHQCGIGDVMVGLVGRHRSKLETLDHAIHNWGDMVHYPEGCRVA